MWVHFFSKMGIEPRYLDTYILGKLNSITELQPRPILYVFKMCCVVIHRGMGNHRIQKKVSHCPVYMIVKVMEKEEKKGHLQPGMLGNVSLSCQARRGMFPRKLKTSFDDPEMPHGPERRDWKI